MFSPLFCLRKESTHCGITLAHKRWLHGSVVKSEKVNGCIFLSFKDNRQQLAVVRTAAVIPCVDFYRVESYGVNYKLFPFLPKTFHLLTLQDFQHHDFQFDKISITPPPPNVSWVICDSFSRPEIVQQFKKRPNPRLSAPQHCDFPVVSSCFAVLLSS